MAREVTRRITTRRQTKGEPWKWRPLWLNGATCLSHHVDPVFYDPDVAEPLAIGRYDWMLRLYQHEGASPASVEHHEGIAYFEREWADLEDRQCEWLEFVKRHDGTIRRVDFGTAKRYGSWVPTPRGNMWVVPSDFYFTK